MNWHYRVKAPAEKVRDPIQGEFFSTEAIKNPADALVREALQNAIGFAFLTADFLAPFVALLFESPAAPSPALRPLPMSARAAR